MEVHFFGFLLDRHSDSVPEIGSRELHAASSYLLRLFFLCRYLILRPLLPCHGALVGFITCHVEFLLAQLAGQRRGGYYGCVRVCHLQYSLVIYFVDL